MLEKFKKSLRLSQSTAESILWYNLRNRWMLNCKFRRQHILQGYIVDFVCLEKNLVIELDGDQHALQVAYDIKRTNTLELNGFKVLRFWNIEVYENLDMVLDVIYRELNTPHPPR